MVDVREPSALPVFRDGFLARWSEEFVRLLAPQWSAMFDVGAHIGTMTVIAAVANPSCSITAFEPDPSLCDVLRRNAASLDTTIVQAAVGRETGTATLFLAVGGAANSVARSSVQARGQAQVAMVALDSFASLKPDFIKVDVEGAELTVLQGAAQIIAGDRPPAWFLEINSMFLSEVSTSSEELSALLPGYATFEWDGPALRLRPVDLRTVSRANVLFVPWARAQEYSRWTD